MKWSKKRSTYMAGLAGLIILTAVFLPTKNSNTAYASPIPYMGQFTIGSQAVYSSEGTKSVDLDIPANKDNLPIEKVTLMRDGVEFQTFPEAKGQLTWKKTITLNGEIIPLVTDKTTGTDSAQGYYAWYRYAYGTEGNQWYAGIDGVRYNCNSGDPDPAYPGMTLFPGCSSNGLGTELSVPGHRTKEFQKENGSPWNDTASVSSDHVTYETTVNRTADVSGPPELGSTGRPDGSTVYLSTTGDINNYKVHYSQDFNNANYQTDLGLPGAKEIVYYAAFNVIIHANTYKYPDELVVTYGPPTTPSPSGPSPSGSSPTPTPTMGKPIGDFDILPSTTINYRDSFQLKPKNIVIPNGCTYQRHEFKLSGSNGSTWISPKQTSQTQVLSFGYPDNYPAPVAKGSVSITMTITASCGTGTASHSLTVNADPDNNPPYFKLGWFNEGDWSSKKPLEQVVQGTKLMVRYIDDPASNPPSPSDPEGDSFSITGWDYNSGSNFVKSLPGKYGFDPRSDYLNGIVMDTTGYHRIGATMADDQGASYTAYTMVEVVPPNPVAACKLNPDNVKSKHPYPDTDFIGTDSYSPLGRQITKYIWGNKKTSYTNTTASPINESITLTVEDSAGMQSLSPATCTLRVDPDLPPIGKLDVPPLAIRNQPYSLMNKSYSPDGDHITSVQYRFKYDGNNNGFSDDPWQGLAGDMTKATFTPNKVGKYLFDILATEDYGQSAYASATQTASSLTLDVVNLAPAVSFTIEGKNKQPEFNPPIAYSASTILNSWSLFQTNSTSTMSSKNWTVSGNSLKAGLGRGFEHQKARYLSYTDSNWGWSAQTFWTRPFADNGYGPNGLNSYRSIKTDSATYTTPVLLPTTSGGTTTWTPFSINPGMFNDYPDLKYQTNKTNIFFLYNGSFYSLNKSKLSKATHSPITSGGDLIGYSWSYPGGNPYDLVINTKGMPGKTVTNFSGVEEGGYPKVVNFELSDNTIFVMIEWQGRDSSGYYDIPIAYDIWTYDTFTGQKIASTMDNGITGLHYYVFDSNFFAYRDKVQLFKFNYEGSFGGYNSYKAWVIDRSGHIVTQQDKLPVPQEPYSFEKQIGFDTYTMDCTPRPSGLFPGLKGETYRYVSTACYPRNYGDGAYFQETYGGTWLQKFDENLNLVWNAQLAGPIWNYGKYNQGTYQDYGRSQDNYADLLLNPARNELVVRSMDTYNLGYVYQTVNMSSGAVGGFPYEFHNSYWNFTMDWTGNYIPNPLDTTGKPKISSAQENYTPEGNRTTLNIANLNTDSVSVYHSSGGLISNFDPDSLSSSNGFLNATKYTAWASVGLKHGFYVGDGMYMSFYNTVSSSIMGGSQNYDYSVWITKGNPSTEPMQFKPYQIGQFVSPFSIDNTEINFTLTMDQARADQELVGMSFRMQDPRNRYAAETDGSKLYLSKYVNGNRTVLASIDYPFQDGTAYSFKIKPSGNSIELDLNGVPYLSATDSSFASGKIGPFSDKSYVSFSNISTKAIPVQNMAWFQGYAIWESGTANASAQYNNITFTDPENDPRAGSNQWSYAHTPKFLNNQGLSALNGQTLTSPQTVFDKVGDYMVTLKARDDPNPSYLFPSNVFDSYRKNSNAFGMKVTVHRRPVAQNSLTVNGDGSVSWNDTSYDPDRWLSSWNYSAPDTPGMNYGVDRGITERKYYYVDPDGSYVERQLVRPPKTGTYEVGLMVKDEYGAWSYPWTGSVYIGSVPPPNNLPTATLTYPNGSSWNPSLENSTRPTITWTQFDWDTFSGGVFTAYNVRILDPNGARASGSGERPQWTSSNSASWTVETDLVRGETYQVQVQVKDSTGEWSEWSNIGWMKINSKPSVTITFPGGTQQNPTIINSNKRPTITWTQTDPEWNYFQKFFIEIRREDGSMVFDTGWNAYQNSGSTNGWYAMPVDLPTGEKLQVRMLVTDHDVNMWSDFSNTTWFKINYPPSVTITNLSGDQWNPTIVGPTPLIEWRQTDPDPNTTYSAYQIRVLSEDGGTEYLNTGVVGQSTTGSYGSYQVANPLPAGRKLQVRIQVWDGYDASSGWSAPGWIFTNRPPLPDFDWTPKPVWEGDTVKLLNRSTDPDGDPLQSEWKIRCPDNSILTADTKDMEARFTLPGTYQVTLSVSDGRELRSITKPIVAEPLTIRSDVNHTPEWLAKHQELGHQTATPPKDFYSGEVMVVSIQSSPAPVSEARAWIDTVGLDGEPLFVETILEPAGGVLFKGELYDERFSSLTERLPDGICTVHFRLIYANGVEKRENVDVNIIDSIQKAVGVHRVQ